MVEDDYNSVWTIERKTTFLFRLQIIVKELINLRKKMCVLEGKKGII